MCHFLSEAVSELFDVSAINDALNNITQFGQYCTLNS